MSLKKVLLSIITSVFVLSISAQTNAATTFSDIENSQMKTQIEALAEAEIVTGSGDGKFRPKANITRAEFAKMLASAMESTLDASAASHFTDLPAWAAPYVGALVNEEVTKGKSATTFGASENISRQEMAVMFVRAMGLEEFVMMELEPGFKDMDKVADWALPHVAFSKEIGFIEGDGVSYYPQNSSLREQVSKLTYQWKFESHIYFENAIESIAQYFFTDIENITLVDQNTINVTLTDGEIIQYEINYFLNYIHENAYYQELSFLNGNDWMEFTISDKQEIIDSILNFWASDYSQFNVLMTNDDAKNLLISKLDTFYVSPSNNDIDIITQLEDTGLQEGIIEYYIQASSNGEKQFPTLK